MTPHRAPVQTPPSLPAVGDASPRRGERWRGTASDRVTVPAGLARATVLNLLIAVALLVWLLPSPWGMLVPVAVLAQAVAWRQGAAAAMTALVAGSVTGAAMGPLLGLGDWRRSAMALLLVVLPALVAWPARGASAGR